MGVERRLAGRTERRPIRTRHPEAGSRRLGTAARAVHRHRFRHETSTGNWAAYRDQPDFEMVEDERLGRLVLPPEVDHAVYVFTRMRTN
jgi:hypothetical protein